MKLKEIVEKLNLKVLAAEDNLERDVSGGYCSDLLSDVIAGSKAGNIWITLQVHQNIVAVASLNDLAAIILINDRQPDPETLEKAEEERIPVLGTSKSTFDICGQLFKLGISGNK